MKKLLALCIFFALCTGSVFGGNQAAKKTEFSGLCKVFLGTDEKTNFRVLEAVQKAVEGRKHLLHSIVFPAVVQKEKAVEEEIQQYKISSFPAIVMNDQLLTSPDELEKAALESSKPPRVAITAHLEKEIVDKTNLTVMCYMCCFVEGESIDKGRVAIYVTEDSATKDPLFKTLIADNRDYNIEIGSCHAPETFYWAIPKEVDQKSLKAIMVAYDGKGKILGTCCTLDDCTEKSKD